MSRNVKIALGVVALLALVALVIWIAVTVANGTARGLVSSIAAGTENPAGSGVQTAAPHVIELPPIEISA